MTAVARGALLLVAALLADGAEYVLDPINGDAGTKVYDAAAAHPGRLVASAVALLASSIFIVPAVRGLTQAVGARGRRMATAATGLSVLGAMGHAALAAMYLIWTQLPKGGASRDEMVALVERVNAAPSMALIGVLIISFALTFLALTIAMARARIVPVWTIALVVGGAIAQGATQTAEPPLSLLPLALVGTAVAVLVARVTDWTEIAAAPRTSAAADPSTG
jgi:hypothetical protein